MVACGGAEPPDPRLPRWSGFEFVELLPHLGLMPARCVPGEDDPGPFDPSVLVLGEVDGAPGLDMLAVGTSPRGEGELPFLEYRLYPDALATLPTPSDEPAFALSTLQHGLSSFADVDGDGLDDLAFNRLDVFFQAGWTDVYLSPLSGAVVEPDDPDLRIQVDNAAVADRVVSMEFDRADPEPELVVLAHDMGALLVFDPVFPGTLGTGDASARIDDPLSWNSEELLVADLTADGTDDVLVMQGSLSSGYLVSEPVAGTAQLDLVATAHLTDATCTGSPFDGLTPIAGDIDGDGALDLFYEDGYSCGDDGLSLTLGPFAGEVDMYQRRSAAIATGGFDDLYDVATGDLDGDGFDDIVIDVGGDRWYDRDLLWVIHGPVAGTWTLNLDPRSHGGTDDLAIPPDSAVLVFPEPGADLRYGVKAGDYVGDWADDLLVSYCADDDDAPTALLISTTPF